MNESKRFHRYAGVWEYRLAGWLLANPFQQTRKFVSDGDPETWHTLKEYLGPYISQHLAGHCLGWVLAYNDNFGRPMQPSDIRQMPLHTADSEQPNSRALLVKKWCTEVQVLISREHAGDGVDFATLRLILANLNEALECMDVNPALWPDHARLGEGYVEPESAETEDVT